MVKGLQAGLRVIKKLSVLGGGEMAQSMLAGLVLSNRYAREDILVYDTNPKVTHDFPVASSTEEAVAHGDGIVVLTGPHQVRNACKSMQGLLDKNSGKIIFGGAAAVPPDVYASAAGNSELPVVQFMTNKASEIKQAITIWHPNQSVPEERLLEIQWLFKGLGPLVFRAQSDNIQSEMNEAIAAIGSGPGLFYAMTNSYKRALIARGFDSERAEAIAKQLLISSGMVVAESNESLDALFSGVATPGGITAAVGDMYELQGLTGVLGSGFDAGYHKAKKIAAAVTAVQSPGEFSVFKTGEDADEDHAVPGHGDPIASNNLN